MKFGAIDIGTNAARLLIGEVETQNDSSFVKKISYTRIPLRLGQDVFEKGNISEEKIDEFIKTINAFKLISDVFRVKELRAVATSAMREASNSATIIERIDSETGVNIDVISGNEEAELIFNTFFLFKIDESVPFVVVDVGGGSTEISIFQNGKRVASKSFMIGTLRLLKGKVKEDIWDEISQWILKNVDPETTYKLFGTGGNINKVHKLLEIGHLQPISLKKISILHEKLKSLTIEERIKRFELKPDRADVIVPALDIYVYIIKNLRSEEIVVPKIGLSDGLIYQMYLDSIK